jgi:hypothetical protein
LEDSLLADVSGCEAMEVEMAQRLTILNFVRGLLLSNDGDGDLSSSTGIENGTILSSVRQWRIQDLKLG